MPPIPDELAPTAPAVKISPVSTSQLEDDDIVISGLSGLFPTCHNAKEFSEKLYKHENFNTCGKKLRWNYEHPELTKHIGNVPGLERFDAQFFMVHYHLAHGTDMMSRKLLEQAYQAIFDSGTSPIEFYGKKVGVFIATSLTETEKLIQAYSSIGTAIMGCNRSMFANRISYWLNAKGPSITLDASCSGSMLCIEKAYEAMSRGDIEAAIVGGCNIHLNPQACIHYDRMFGMNPDGKTKCFDKNADGPSPSECISVFLLQKAKDAKRIYANVCYVKTEYSFLDADFSDRYGPYRDSSILSSFYNNFYKASNVMPHNVEYVEAYGSAYPEADKNELEAIQEVFCKDRSDRDPLQIGSVMSNMGYSNAATTAAALTKVCLAYQTGKIAANLHYVTPHDDVPAMCDGRMRVVTDNRPFGRSYAAINSLSLSGINGHLLLKGQYKPKDQTLYKSEIPYLLMASARQETGVQLIFDDFKANPIDPEVNALLHNLQKHNISKHLARGYTILTSDEKKKTVCLKEKVDYFDDAKKPLWFVYSGMGSQWNEMGKALMRIPIFAAAIKRCHKVLEPKGMDLLHIITTDDRKIFDNIINSFVGISAVQIGITNVLLSMGLVPDNLIGHSMGEMGCAYADGCVTLEEVMLAAYYRGLVSTDTPLIKGSMAAVGLGYEEIKSICPPEIDVGCHNSRESCTLSGPYEVMKEFITKLNDQGIFAKGVNSCHRAYHSRYIQDAGPPLLKYLKNVIKNPKPRSQKWLSTSVPKEKWNEPLAQTSSAEYHVNNMRSPVLFEETAVAIPANAVLIEIAPHGLLQAILKRSLPPTCLNIPLTRRGHPDSTLFLLEAIGELYMAGFNPDLSILYPKVEFPVSSETRSLSHLVEWVHDEKWRVPVHVNADRVHAAAYETTISTYDDEFRFLKGHIINNETVFPPSCALELVWDTLAMSLEAQRKQISVQFNDVHLHAQPLIFDHRLLKYRVEIHRGTGWFEVTNEDLLLASGYVRALEQHSVINYQELDKEVSDHMVYTSDDIYKMLFDKGYCYRGEFRSIQNENADMTRSLISWNGNWTTLIDAAIQMNILRRDSDVMERPRFIQQLSINLKMHNHALQNGRFGTKLLEAYYSENQNQTRCGGVALRNVLFTSIQPRERKDMLVEFSGLKFVPHDILDVSDISKALSIFMQILAENIDNSLNGLDVTQSSFLSSKIKNLLWELPMIKLNINKTTVDKIQTEKNLQAPDFMLVDNSRDINDVGDVIPCETFVIFVEEQTVSNPMYKVVASAMTPNGRLVLGRLRPKAVIEYHSMITVTSPEDIVKVKAAKNNLSSNCTLNILTHYPPMNELKDLVERWKKDSSKTKVYMAMFPKTELKNLQANKLPKNLDLVYNVVQNGVVGGYFFINGHQKSGNELRVISLKSSQIGNLDSLHWTETPEPNSANIAVSVHYSGLNFFDAKKATGDLSTRDDEVPDQQYGMDFSGVTSSGERVMGVVRRGAASTLVSADPTLLWPVPEHWTLEDAATVPLAYAHALYCLGVKVKLYYGMSVLVHGAAGALGQAVISIALANKCTVFAAVNNIRKKQLLQRVFPNLPSNQIGYSRHEAFGDMVLTATKGKGCDIVISCVNGPLKKVSLSCCAAWGTTIDTQAIHSKEDNIYGMYNMTKCRSYVATDFSAVFEPENYEERKQLKVMVSEGIARGFIRPLSRITYGAQEPARAMRLLAKSQHFGRVLLRLHGEAIATTKRLAISASGSHLVISTSADNDVAVNIVDLLIQRGAVNVVLQYERHTVESAYMSFKKEQWKKLGANVKVTFDKANYEELIKTQNIVSPIDGIYIIGSCASDKEADNVVTSVVADLDKITRKLCSSLRKFALINNGAGTSRDIFINRTQDELPAIMLQLPKIAKFDDEIEDKSNNNDSVLVRNIMPLLEDALCSAGPVAALHTRTNELQNLIEEVSQLANLNSEGDYNKTMRELGLKTEQTQEFIQLLQKYDVVVPAESVLDLTLGHLISLQENIKLENSKVSTGLDVLLSSVDTDELQATTDLVFLPTADQKSVVRGDEFDFNATFMVMIPGIDGHYGKFKTLCERLKLSAAVLQPGLDNVHETFPEMARRLVKVMLKKLNTKEKFYLVGYSFGVYIALEMAALLEKHGLTGVVYCVDASPESFPSSIESWLQEAGATNTSQLQNAIVQHVITLLAGGKPDHLTEQLLETNAWEDKIEVGIRALCNKVPHSKQYARAVMEAAYARIVQSLQYDSRHLSPLRSQIVLLRSRSNPHTSPDLGLARYSEQKPHVYYIDKDHATALDDLQCAEIINKHLDEQTLINFQKKNLCTTYLRNAETFADYVDDDEIER